MLKNLFSIVSLSAVHRRLGALSSPCEQRALLRQPAQRPKDHVDPGLRAPLAARPPHDEACAVGRGVVPIAGETLGGPSAYGADRIFVRLRSADAAAEAGRDRAMQQLTESPILTLDIAEPSALGAEFARWEIATAVAGALLGVNPFDEPNVKQAKDVQMRCWRGTPPKVRCR